MKRSDELQGTDVFSNALGGVRKDKEKCSAPLPQPYDQPEHYGNQRYGDY